MPLIPSLFQQHFLLRDEQLTSSLPSPLRLRCALHPAVLLDCGGCSGLLLLGEVEDLTVGLPQVLLLFEVHFKRPLDGHKGDTSLEEKKEVC